MNRELVTTRLTLRHLIAMMFLFFLSGLQLSHADNRCAFSSPEAAPTSAYEVPVGVFITSIYDLDFTDESVSVSAWIWSTYDPNKLPKDFVFFECIELTNARSWSVSSIEQFILTNEDGSKHAMGKITATLNQNWDTSHFPFDKQQVRLSIEAVGLDSSQLKYRPDVKNTNVSEDFRLSDWSIGSPSMKAFDYQYNTTFGTGAQGKYPRLDVAIPIERKGTRIFITAFIGFFVAYLIIVGMVIFDRNMIGERVSQLMTALFAAIGNKTLIDYFPSQSEFSLSDLIQVATFAIIALGLLNTVIFIQLVKRDRDEMAYRINKWIFLFIAPSYPLVIGYGLFRALNA